MSNREKFTEEELAAADAISDLIGERVLQHGLLVTRSEVIKVRCAFCHKKIVTPQRRRGAMVCTIYIDADDEGRFIPHRAAVCGRCVTSRRSSAGRALPS